MPDTREAASPSPPSAIAALVHCFTHPLHQARARHAAGDTVVGVVSHAVPLEILRAAGLSTVVVRPTTRAARFSDELLEPGVFAPRIRALFESAMAGDLDFLSALAFARTSEQDYKCYLYLREVVREGGTGRLPALWFYDLLHSPSDRAYQYGLARTRALVTQVEAKVGRAIGEADLAAAVAEANASRAAIRRLLALRHPEPRLTGAEALALAGSSFLMDRTSYAPLARRAAAEAEHRPPLPGPRLIVAGAWLDDSSLHALIESHGAVVVAEDGGWGTRAAGHDIEPRADAVAAIFDKYFRDGPSVRQFPPTTEAWLHGLPASGIEGVVFYLPPDDSVAGWDYPIARRRLDALGIPSLVIRDEVNDPGMAGRWHEPIAAFVQRAARERRSDG